MKIGKTNEISVELDETEMKVAIANFINSNATNLPRKIKASDINIGVSTDEFNDIVELYSTTKIKLD